MTQFPLTRRVLQAIDAVRGLVRLRDPAQHRHRLRPQGQLQHMPQDRAQHGPQRRSQFGSQFGLPFEPEFEPQSGPEFGTRLRPQGIAVRVLVVAVLVLQTPVLPPRALLLVAAVSLAVIALWGGLCCRSTGTPWLPVPVPCRVDRNRVLPGVRLTVPALTMLGAGLITLLPAVAWQTSLLPDACERRKVELTGVVRGLPRRLAVTTSADDPREADGMPLYSFELTVRRLEPADCRGPARVRLYYRPGNALEASAAAVALMPGATLQLQARLRRPWGLVNPYAQEGERRFLLAGVHAVGSVAAAGVTPVPDTTTLPGRLDRGRAAISRWLRSQQGDEIGGLLAALAVGDRRFIDPESWTRLRVYGLTHAFVISGLHITLIALPGWLLGGFLRRLWSLLHLGGPTPDWPGPLLALLFAALYACLAGLSLPTLRALLALALALLPLLARRPLDRGRLLAICALLLWLLDPLSVLGASYWLSLGAVALLLWFSLWAGDAGGIRKVAGTQVLMLCGMLPLSLFWFGEGSTVGGALNLVAIPLLTLLVVPLLLAAVALAPLLEGPATLCLEGAAAAVAALWYAMGHWEPLLRPAALLAMPAGIPAVLLGLLAAAVLGMPAFRGRAALLVLLAAPLLLPRASDSQESLRLTVFDVGQGTAVLLRQGGQSLLYDTGGGPPGATPVAVRSVLPLLRGERLRSLDHLVISHADRDHDAGEAVVRALAPPRRIWRAVAEGDDERCRLGKTLPFGTAVRLTFLSLSLPADSDNDGSCVLLIEAFGQRILLPGDIERERERELLAYWGPALAAAVTLPAHHGSGTSSGRSWIRTVDPRLAIVTAARASPFGHPSPEVVARFEERGVALLNTAHDGAIELHIGADGRLGCRRLRHRWQPFWRRGSGDPHCLPHAVR